jgi:hypothetical protein
MPFIMLGCQKSTSDIEDPATAQRQENDPKNGTSGEKILVDASKDGGVWWFPQGTGAFSADADHQGKALADYLRNMGYQVDELPRGVVITASLLSQYDKIIRAPAFFPYTDAEIGAYDNFLKKPGSLMLLQDHLTYTTNDKLSEHLGIEFSGAVSGTVTDYAAHQITQGVSELPYIAGSVITNASNNPAITILGSLDNASFLDLNNNGVFDADDINAPPVMGILTNYPSSKIFFMGDGNGIEAIPQPLTQNLISWLFQ